MLAYVLLIIILVTEMLHQYSKKGAMPKEIVLFTICVQ